MMKIIEATPSLLEQVNGPKDPSSLTDQEKKHVPRIECPGTVEANVPFEVTVSVGVGIDHPSELAHFIGWIGLGRTDADIEICRLALDPKFSLPHATLKITLDRSTTLVARACCNLHGVWENRKKIDVK